MKAKFIGVGTVVGAIFLFMWGALLHSGLPMETQGMTALPPAAMAALKLAPMSDGVYFGQGVWAAISLQERGGRDPNDIGPMLIREVFTDLAGAFLLCLLLLAVKCKGTMERAGVLAMAATAACMENQVSDWNWYGFSAQFSILEAVDIVGGWFLLGIILSLLKNKLAPEA